MSDTRLKELILYIAKDMERPDHAGRGRIKMAKLIWRCDFAAYWFLGEPITETSYVADEHGPAPVGEMLATRDLESSGYFEWRNDWDRQEIPVAHRDPNMDLFSTEQRKIIDDQLAQYRHITGSVMRDQAHGFSGWIYAWDRRTPANKRPPIPFESVFWDSRTELEDWEQEEAQALAVRLGMQSA